MPPPANSLQLASERGCLQAMSDSRAQPLLPRIAEGLAVVRMSYNLGIRGHEIALCTVVTLLYVNIISSKSGSVRGLFLFLI